MRGVWHAMGMINTFMFLLTFYSWSLNDDNIHLPLLCAAAATLSYWRAWA